jgi:hypothetical protein
MLAADYADDADGAHERIFFAPHPRHPRNPRPTFWNRGTNVTPTDEYKRRLDSRRAAVERCRRLDGAIASGRLVAGVVFAMTVLGIWFDIVSGWLILLPIAAFAALVIYHGHIYAVGRRAIRAVDFYEKGLARIEDRWVGTGQLGLAYYDESHAYTSDLDIFGKGSLFELLSTARTRAGEDRLASWLSAPASGAEISRRQKVVEELRNNIDLREDLALLGDDIKATVHPDRIKSWGLKPPLLSSSRARIVAPILAAAAVASLINYFFFEGNGSFAVLAVGLEGAFALHYRQRVREVMEESDQPEKELEILSLVLARIEREQFKSDKLRELRAALDTNGKPPSVQIKKLMRLIDWLNNRRNPGFALIGPFLLWATQFSFAIEAWRHRCGPALGGWLDAVAEFEALCALAGYAYEHPDDPFPEVLETGPFFEGDELRHPLLPTSRCVPNSVRLGAAPQLLLVSGSNMSGKSTLMRTVGINVVLALAGAPVRAKRLRLSVLAIGSTIRVLDSLQGGTSRFYAEIQRLKHIMDLAKESPPVLFLLDEILHGTNSHDRAMGAEAVVRGLVERGAIGLVTTHDLALARVADSLSPKAANVHFEDHLENGRMVFDYRLRPGIVQKSNALELMRAVGLEV